MEEKNRKRKWKHKLQTFSLTMVFLFVLLISFVLIWENFYEKESVVHGPYNGPALTVIYIIIFYAFGELYQMFKISIKKISEVVYSGFLSILMSTFFIYVIISLLQQKLASFNSTLIFIAIQLFIVVVWAIFSHRVYFNINIPKRTMIIYDEKRDLDGLIKSYGLEKRYEVSKILSIEEFNSDVENSLKDIDSIFVSGIRSSDRNDILKHSIHYAIDVYVIPKVGDIILQSSEDLPLFHLPVLKVERYNPSIAFLVLKRLLDIVVSGIALIVLSPVILITSLLIYFTDKGPVFYKQTRLTKNGKHFEVLKFRSMRVDAEKDGVARLSTGKKDDRITPVGKYIRATRIDEIPQLINIFKGEMSIVGPRPERPEIAKQYEEILPEFKLRLQAKAGLTGYAQVYGKYNTTPYDKLLMDLIYISNPSLLEDFKICFVTVKILFMKDSTEGIDEGKTTA